MHYRKTGKFAEAMLEATRDMSSPHHLYALGYLTHVAADTVGRVSEVVEIGRRRNLRVN